jgi:hypothetical protein
MFRRSLINVLLLLLILAGLNWLYTHTFYKKDLEEKAAEAVRIRQTQEVTDIYYFGESSNVSFAETDSVTSSISELTNLFYPSLTITNINKYATHAGIYKEWIKMIDLRKKKPEALIITLNLRSFDAAWIHSRLETQLQESLVLTRPYPRLMNRFLLSLQAFDNKTEQQREQDMKKEWRTTRLEFPYPAPYQTVAEWDEAMARGTYLRPDGSWDMDKIALACHYIKGYAFNLNAQNPRIRDFDQITAWCERNKINLYLNLMAENIAYADSLVGKDLVFLMRQNRDYLVKRYSGGVCRVIDNLELVRGREFIDQNWTTEHYNDRGRMRIAKNLAESLKEKYKNEYKLAY